MIKEGDTVEHKTKQGLGGVVAQVSPAGILFSFEGSSSWCVLSDFKMVDTSKHHKHHDLIIAWAKGEEIEFWWDDRQVWAPSRRPQWFESYTYRIKTTEPTELEKLQQKYKELGDAITKLKES